MTTDDAKPIIRTLRDVLVDARPFVEQVTDQYDALLLGANRERAAAVLERVDGAIAEADEVLT